MPKSKFVKVAGYVLAAIAVLILLFVMAALLIVVIKGTIFLLHWKV